MFGYIKPLECELRVREQKEYRAVYCGLCRAIGSRYGQLPRLALNYDCTFLAILLSALTERPHPDCRARVCGVRAYRGKNPIAEPSEALAYAADVNVLLAARKLGDDWADEHKLASWGGHALLQRADRAAGKRWPELAATIDAQLSQLSKIEARRASCTDEPSDAFGALMREIVLHAPMLRQEDRAAAAWMFYNLGRWVYLIDAWDDREKDRKSGAYNPFLATNMDEDAASFLLYISLNEAEKGYDLLPIPEGMGLLDNIVHEGCRSVTRRVLQKESGHEPV